MCLVEKPFLATFEKVEAHVHEKMDSYSEQAAKLLEEATKVNKLVTFLMRHQEDKELDPKTLPEEQKSLFEWARDEKLLGDDILAKVEKNNYVLSKQDIKDITEELKPLVAFKKQKAESLFTKTSAEQGLLTTYTDIAAKVIDLYTRRSQLLTKNQRP